ncbi:MAG: DUF1499 domain-containing protein [Pseudomonadota bacterium]
MVRILIWLISIGAILTALVIASAGPGTRLGLWEYGDGLGLIRKAAMPAMIAGGLSVLAVIASAVTARGLLPISIIAATASLGAASVPMQMKALFEGNPFIHDITTDFDNPPPILAAAGDERNNPPEYLGDEKAPRSEMTVTQAQADAFPDIVSIETSMSVDDAAVKAEDAIRAMGMTIIANNAHEDGRLIEAYHQSPWFGFIDDFVVRVSPSPSGAILDIRSKSRVGGSDLGANAKRVRTFMKKFEG